MRLPAFLLKVRDPYRDTYSTVAGLKTTRAHFRPKALEIEAAGIFCGSAAERQMKTAVLGANELDLELSFENGERYRGKFTVAALSPSGDFNGERNYALHLVPAGETVMVHGLDTSVLDR